MSKLNLKLIAQQRENNYLTQKSEEYSKQIASLINEKNIGIKDININNLLNPDISKKAEEEAFISLAKDVAKQAEMSEEVYSPLFMMYLAALIQKKEFEAKALLNVIFSATIYLTTLDEGAEKIGALGGRPEHPHKAETLSIAQKRWLQIPYASLNSVATYVKAKMDNHYTNAPKLPTIKAWLNKSGIKPGKKTEI